MRTEPKDHAELERKLDGVLKQQRELIDRLQEGQNYFQHLARSVWRVQEDERRRLARELHDGVGHSLTALIHLVAQASAAIVERPDEARERLDRARAVAQTTLQETRALSRLLRPQILDDLGLEAALRWLARSFHDDHRLTASLDFDVPFPSVDGDLATLVFRVTQESLSNIAKHAQAKTVEIALHQRASFLALSIRDDGRGCDPEKAFAAGSEGRSSGLGGMRDRVRLFGGALRLDAQIDAGCHVSAQFPLSPPAAGLSA
ncbi:MAG TPA: sensor histidine kinase [Rhodanobacteraceae bacterium]|jgi:signal transduction histidine kinase|nr:sensor histidine kinase [Rhodanobacteraceae bacterium]